MSPSNQAVDGTRSSSAPLAPVPQAAWTTSSSPSRIQTHAPAPASSDEASPATRSSTFSGSSSPASSRPELARCCARARERRSSSYRSLRSSATRAAPATWPASSSCSSVNACSSSKKTSTSPPASVRGCFSGTASSELHPALVAASSSPAPKRVSPPRSRDASSLPARAAAGELVGTGRFEKRTQCVGELEGRRQLQRPARVAQHRRRIATEGLAGRLRHRIERRLRRQRLAEHGRDAIEAALQPLPAGAVVGGPGERDACPVRELLHLRELLVGEGPRRARRGDEDADRLRAGVHRDESAALRTGTLGQALRDRRRRRGVEDGERDGVAQHGSDPGRLRFEVDPHRPQPVDVTPALARGGDAGGAMVLGRECERDQIDTEVRAHVVGERRSELVRIGSRRVRRPGTLLHARGRRQARTAGQHEHRGNCRHEDRDEGHPQPARDGLPVDERGDAQDRRPRCRRRERRAPSRCPARVPVAA